MNFYFNFAIIPAMSNIRHSILVFYFFLLSIFVTNQVISFFAANSPKVLYFLILGTFDVGLYYIYFLSFIQVSLNIAHLIPVFFYIQHISFLPKSFWKKFFILKIIFDVVGHNYEWVYLVSLFHYNPKVFVIVFISSIAIYIPSYIFCYRYAFKYK